MENLHVRRGLIALSNGLIEEARGHFERAVRISPRVPGAYLQLGICYLARQQGDKVDNIRKAQECFQKGLRFFHYAFFPRDHALFLEALGDAHSHISSLEQADEWEEAIICHQRALEIFQGLRLQEHWPRLLNKLGRDYCDRRGGDRHTNLKQAIDHFKEALPFFVKSKQPELQAHTQLYLGSAYRQLPIDPEGNPLWQALCYYVAALQVQTEERNPQGYAALQNNIANVFMTPPLSQHHANQLRAISAYQKALKVIARTEASSDYPLTEFNLGQAYLNLSEGDRETQVKEAVKCFRETLKSVDREQQPQLYALASSALDRAYQTMMQKPRDMGQLPGSAVMRSRAIEGSDPENHRVKSDNGRPIQEKQP